MITFLSVVWLVSSRDQSRWRIESGKSNAQRDWSRDSGCMVIVDLQTLILVLYMFNLQSLYVVFGFSIELKHALC